MLVIMLEGGEMVLTRGLQTRGNIYSATFRRAFLIRSKLFHAGNQKFQNLEVLPIE